MAFSDQPFVTKGRLAVAAAAACLLAGLLWWTAGDASRAESRNRFQAALLPDVIPATPLELHGNILLVGFAGNPEGIDEPGSRPGHRRVRTGCAAVCAALLALPGVDSVTVTDKARYAAWRFRVVPRATCDWPSVIPQQPDILRTPQTASQAAVDKVGIDAAMLADHAQETAWRIRLSASDCIIADQVGTVADFTVRDQTLVAFGHPNWRMEHDDWAWTFAPLPVQTQRLEIRGSDGTVRMRRSFTSTPILAKPLHPGAVARTGSLGFPVYGWSRDTLGNFEPGERYDARALLMAHTNIAGGLRPIPPRADVAKALRRVLGDPRVPENDPAFGLSQTWMRSLADGTVTDADKSLLVDLVKDRRVTDFRGLGRAVRALGADARFLAGPIRRRIEADAGNPEVGRTLTRALDRIAEQAPG